MPRISNDRMKKAQEQLANITPEDHEKVMALANIVKPLRSILHKTPDDYGLKTGKTSTSNPTMAPHWKAGTSPPPVAKATS